MTQNKSDLDALVDDYQQPSKQQQEDVAELKKWKADQEQKNANEAASQEYETAMKDNMAFVREGTDIKSSDLVVRGLINSIAESDQSFVEAYKNRIENPDAYRAAQEKMRETAKKELTIDTSSAKVVQAHLAADGHSNDEPVVDRNGKTDAEIMKMNDQEFEVYKTTLR